MCTHLSVIMLPHFQLILPNITYNKIFGKICLLSTGHSVNLSIFLQSVMLKISDIEIFFFFKHLHTSQNEKQLSCCFLVVVWFVVGVLFCFGFFWGVFSFVCFVFLQDLVLVFGLFSVWVFLFSFISIFLFVFLFVCMFSLKIWAENCSESITNLYFCLVLGFVSGVL